MTPFLPSDTPPSDYVQRNLTHIDERILQLEKRVKELETKPCKHDFDDEVRCNMSNYWYECKKCGYKLRA